MPSYCQLHKRNSPYLLNDSYHVKLFTVTQIRRSQMVDDQYSSTKKLPQNKHHREVKPDDWIDFGELADDRVITKDWLIDWFVFKVCQPLGYLMSKPVFWEFLQGIIWFHLINNDNHL